MKLVYFTEHVGKPKPQFEVLVSEETGEPVALPELVEAIRVGTKVDIRQASAEEQNQFGGVIAISVAFVQIEQAIRQAFGARPGVGEVAKNLMFDAIEGVIKSCPIWGSIKSPGTLLIKTQPAAAQ
jgi:hypothetical protein